MGCVSVPDGWQHTTLGQLIRIKHGYAFKGEYFSSSGQYILLTPGNFHPDGGIKLKGDKEKYYSGKFPSKFLLNIGELLIVMTDLTQKASILGSPAFIPENDKFLHNQRLGKISVNSRIDIRFLYHVLNDHLVRAQIKGSATGATVKHTAPERIYAVNIYLPPLPIQRKIAAILSTYDDLIENNLRRTRILEEIARNLYREWFVRFRFPGHEKTRFVDSPLGKIPKGWEVRGLLENNNWVFISRNIGRYEGGKRYFATADVDGITITGEGVEYPHKKKPSRAQKQPTLNSVWFARMQEAYKVLVVAKPNECLARNCMLSSGFAGFQARDRESLAFLFLTINSKEFHREKDRYCTGATQRSLTNAGLERIQTICPPREIVKAFGLVVMDFIDQLLLLQQRNAVLRQTRDLLLPKLISGELDVSELDIAVPAEAGA